MQSRPSILVLFALGGCCLDVGGIPDFTGSSAMSSSTATSPPQTSQTSTNGATGGLTAGSTGGTNGGATGGSDGKPFVTTLAGNGGMAFNDGTGGPNGTAEFNQPYGVAVDAAGNVYVADYANARIRKIDPGGNVTTLAGNGAHESLDGTGGPTGTAAFALPASVTVDGAGDVFVADDWNCCIRKVDVNGNVTTVAGNPGAPSPTQLGQDGTGDPNGTATFNFPQGIVWDATGNLFVGDQADNRVRRIDPAGNVTTLAGSGVEGFADGTAGPDGTAEFALLWGVAVDAAGNVYVADPQNNRIRKVDASGSDVTTVAGNGTGSYADGTGGPNGSAEFSKPTGVAAAPDGTLYIADSLNNRIRKIDLNGNVTTIAGNGTPGFADGSGGSAEFNNPLGIAVDAAGNLYVADTGNNRIRKIRGSP